MTQLGEFFDLVIIRAVGYNGHELGNLGCHKVANCTKTMRKLENTENWNGSV